MTDFSDLLGRRVRYRGDQCNAPREGVIERIETDRWGTHATIRFDNAEAIGWLHGEAVHMNDPTTTISPSQIREGQHELFRFLPQTAEQHLAERNRIANAVQTLNAAVMAAYAESLLPLTVRH